jgi:hypothetical protein
MESMLKNSFIPPIFNFLFEKPNLKSKNYLRVVILNNDSL